MTPCLVGTVRIAPVIHFLSGSVERGCKQKQDGILENYAAASIRRLSVQMFGIP